MAPPSLQVMVAIRAFENFDVSKRPNRPRMDHCVADFFYLRVFQKCYSILDIDRNDTILD